MNTKVIEIKRRTRPSDESLGVRVWSEKCSPQSIIKKKAEMYLVRSNKPIVQAIWDLNKRNSAIYCSPFPKSTSVHASIIFSKEEQKHILSDTSVLNMK